jgi:hypothetical protein
LRHTVANNYALLNAILSKKTTDIGCFFARFFERYFFVGKFFKALNFFVTRDVSLFGRDKEMRPMKNSDHHADENSEKTAAPDFQQFFKGFNDSIWCKDDALEAICQSLEKVSGTQCSNCGGKTRRAYGSRIKVCLVCNRKGSVTAGTFFHNMREPVAWVRGLGAFDRGLVCSKAELKRITSLASSSAGDMFNKLTKTILEDLMNDSDACARLDSSLFLTVFGKRSIETSRRQPPKSEQQEYEESIGTEELQTVPMDLEKLEMIPAAEYVYNLLSEKALTSDELVTSAKLNHGDVLAGVTMLEIAGLVHVDKEGRLAVEKQRVFVANSIELGTALDGAQLTKLVERLLLFITENFHAVSRKYIQLYLAAHWWHQQKDQWNKETISMMCAKAAYFRGKDLLRYVSGVLVKAACPIANSS